MTNKNTFLFYIEDTNGHGYFVDKDKDWSNNLDEARPFYSRMEAELIVEGWMLEDCKVVELAR